MLPISAKEAEIPRTLPARSRVIQGVVLILLCASAAQAQLGQPVQGPAQRRESLHLEKSETRAANGYRYNVMSSDNLVVKEYIHPGTNAIFGVTWKGKRMPSLQALLGFDPYKISGPGVSRTLHTAQFGTDSLSVAIVAFKGRYEGRVVRIDLLPQGVSPSVVTP